MKRIHLTSIAFLVLFSLLCVGCATKSEFTPEKWAGTELENRHRLYEDLMSKYDFIGMTIYDVQNLLGAPQRSYNGEPQETYGNSISYVIGYAAPAGVRFFALYYDDDGIVFKTSTFYQD